MVGNFFNLFGQKQPQLPFSETEAYANEGFETIAALAAELQQSTIWSFWWD